MNQIELEDGDLITAYDFLMEKESLMIGTQNGLLLLHNVDDNSTEIVGQVEGGAKWCYYCWPCSSKIQMALF